MGWNKVFIQIHTSAEWPHDGFMIKNGLVVCLVNDKLVPGDTTQLKKIIFFEQYGPALGGLLGQHKLDILVKKRF